MIEKSTEMAPDVPISKHYKNQESGHYPLIMRQMSSIGK